ncbi:uncharacterized protein LOC108670262 [Hyalella azteca]|uniref:Uncharacterized protein LOC108670262 n=1 Tax=Hyalella azteca TaxID=294128 RepID=A0A8B7NHU6_HYAAZ|nr:uncharacterized protein LOC108670262 [Hyalella azteca]XP_047740104.1 uncharacterized protein LOC108670262 [Hyalella azteca]
MAAWWAATAARLLAVVSALARPWAVGGVGLSFTVQLSQESFDGEQEKVWAGSPVACGGQCRLNPECGAFAFNATEVPNCVLFVRQTWSSPGLPGLYYRGMALSSGDRLFRLPHPAYDVPDQLLAACKAIGLRLVQVPTVLKDLVAVQSQGQFCYDLKRTSETASFTTMTGRPVDASLLVIQDNSSKSLAPQCIASHYNWPFRMGCADWIIKSDATVCQYTP